MKVTSAIVALASVALSSVDHHFKVNELSIINHTDDCYDLVADPSGDFAWGVCTTYDNVPKATPKVIKVNQYGAVVASWIYEGEDEAKLEGIAVSSGGVFISGRTKGKIFGANMTSTNGAGMFDYFVARLNPIDASVMWGAISGSPTADDAFGVSVNEADNAVYATGYLDSGSNEAPWSGPSTPFVARFNMDTGALEWESGFGQTGQANWCENSVSYNGYVYAVGVGYAWKGFVARLSTNGTMMNVYVQDDGHYIGVKRSGNSIVVTGKQEVPTNAQDVVVLSFDLELNLQDSPRAHYGQSGEQSGYTLDIDPTNSYMFIGGFTTAGFPGYTHLRGANRNAFFSMLAPNGTHLWTYQYSAADRVHSVVIFPNGVVLFAASLGGSGSWWGVYRGFVHGSTALSESTIASRQFDPAAYYVKDSEDVCFNLKMDTSGTYAYAGCTTWNGVPQESPKLKKYDIDLNELGSWSYAGSAEAGAEGMYVTSSAVYICGLTKGDFFGASMTGSNGGGYSDYYVAKINATDGAVLWATIQGTATGDGCHALTVDEANSAVYVTGYLGTTPDAQPWAAGSSQPFVARFNEVTGALDWSIDFGDASQPEWGDAITFHENFVYSVGAGAGWRAYIAKVSNNGTLIHYFTDDYGHFGSVEVMDNQLVVSGKMDAPSNGADVVVAVYDFNLVQVSKSMYGAAGEQMAKSLYINPVNKYMFTAGYAVSGFENFHQVRGGARNGFFSMLSPNGTEIWTVPHGLMDHIWSIIQFPNGVVMWAGSGWGNLVAVYKGAMNLPPGTVSSTPEAATTTAAVSAANTTEAQAATSNLPVSATGAPVVMTTAAAQTTVVSSAIVVAQTSADVQDVNSGNSDAQSAATTAIVAGSSVGGLIVFAAVGVLVLRARRGQQQQAPVNATTTVTATETQAPTNMTTEQA